MGDIADMHMDSMWDDLEFFGDFDYYPTVRYRPPSPYNPSVAFSGDFLPSTEAPYSTTPKPKAPAQAGVCKACNRRFPSLSRQGLCATDQLKANNESKLSSDR